MSNSPAAPRPSLRSRMGTMMRRSSSGLTFPTPGLKVSGSKGSLSDSSKDSKGSSLKVEMTLSPPSTLEPPVVSPVAESPAREAAASTPPLLERLEAPIYTDVTQPDQLAPAVSVPFGQHDQFAPAESAHSEQPAEATPAVEAFEQPAEVTPAVEAFTTEPEETIPEPLVPNTMFTESPRSDSSALPTFVPPPTEVGLESPDKAYGLPYFQRTILLAQERSVDHAEPGPEVSVVSPPAEDPWSTFHTGENILPQTPPNRGRESLSKRSTTISERKSNDELVAESKVLIQHAQVSRKSSQSSMASSYAWSARADRNQRSHTQKSRNDADTKASSSARNSIDDPFIDPPAKRPPMSPVESIQMPEPSRALPYIQMQNPSEMQSDGVSAPLSMPYSLYDAAASKTTTSAYSLTGRKGETAIDPDETSPLLPRIPSPQKFVDASGSALPLGNARRDTSGTPLQTLGWRLITLPDNTVYFFHSDMHITTDVDLRTSKKLEAISTYLQESHLEEDALPPAGWELWLVNAGTTKNDFSPLTSWINHAERRCSSDSPFRLQLLNGAAHQAEIESDDRLDFEYRYWAFMESHPAHAPLPHNARADAIDALTWSYTDCLLPSARPLPPPFVQDECQELMKLLRSLDSNSQQVVHTRIVSRILMRLAQWRQYHFRPDKPLPTDTSKNGIPKRERRIPFRKTIRDFFISTVCFGLPYLFLERAHPLRIVDEESGIRSAGPMLAIGACSCLVAAIILSASVTLITLPGLDNFGRIAGFVAILCSTASMISAVMALFRYKADMERTVVYIGGEGLVMLSRRSIVMSLPLVFLAWGIVSFIAGITLYSFRGFTVTPPGLVKHHFEELTHWIVIGVMGVLAGVLIISALLLRR